MTAGGIHKILLVSVVCFCMTLAYPIDDNEKAKTTQAPLAGAEHLAKAQEKDAKLEEQKHPEGSASSNDKQQHKPGDIDLHPKPEKPQDSKDQHAQHPEKPSEQTTLVPGHDHQKPHDHNDQIAVPTEEKKEEQKDIELRHLAPEHSSVGSFPPKDASLAAGKLEHGKKDKDEQLHQEKKIEEAILASSGALDKKPDDKAHPESTPATEAKDDQKTTSEHQAITEAPGKAETGEGHGTTGAPGASTTIAENQPEHENKPHHDQAAGDQKSEQRSELSREGSELSKETTEANQQQTTAGIQEQTSTSASTSINPNL